MSAKTIDVCLPEALFNKIEALTIATARTQSFLTVEALTNYVQN